MPRARRGSSCPSSTDGALRARWQPDERERSSLSLDGRIALVTGAACGIGRDQATKTVELWLICWLGTIVLLTLTTLRLPWSFTLLLGLVDVALALLLVGTARGSETWTHAGGAVVWGFVAVAVYLYVDITSKETGGRGLPLGRPLLGG
jgi:succinate-acetate transporter protein